MNYHHVIHALRRKPMALMNLVYRDQLFPREAYRRAFERLCEAPPERQACRIVVDLLALAHDRSCEAELAEILTADLDAGLLPEVALLRARFAPDPASLPLVTVELYARGALQDHGAAVSLSDLSRVFRRHGITRKKGRSTRPSRRVRP